MAKARESIIAEQLPANNDPGENTPPETQTGNDRVIPVIMGMVRKLLMVPAMVDMADRC